VRNLTNNQQELRWERPTETLADLLRALSARYGVAFERRLFEGDSLSPTIIILVNGRDTRHLAGLATPLTPDDVVAIFPMVAGG
jgi:sulfur-carrier protein